MSAVMMPNAPPALSSATACAVENFPAGAGKRGEETSGPGSAPGMDAGKGRTCAEEGERDREEEEQNDEPEVPAKRCDPGSAA